MQQESLHSIVRKAEQNLVHGSTKIGKYVDWSMHDTLETITAYLNSRFTTGANDSLGRPKPFFNIVTAATNIWYRATDIDRKDIRFVPTKMSNTGLVFIANVLLQNWMNESGFGTFLNQWGRALAAYGSSVVEFTEKGDDLIAEVIAWNRVICDPVDFEALPRIKKIYKTPAQLRKITAYNKAIVKELIEAQQPRNNLDGQQIDNQSEFIELYEIKGDLPLALLMEAQGQKPNESDWETYVFQMHTISYVKDKDGKYSDFTLFSGRLPRDPQMITHMIEEDGRTLAIGAVEYLFTAQWMANHTMKQWKDQMDLSSKLVFQTADKFFVGRNVINAIESGDIMIHEDGKPLELLPNEGHDITNLQAFAGQWRVLGQELTSTPDALRGNTLPSGTPYALGNLLSQNASSLFEIMTENKGLAIEEMIKRYVIPHIKKKLAHKEQIVAILNDAGISEIDAKYIPNQAVRNYNRRAADQILRNPMMPVQPFDQQQEQLGVQQGLATLGNKRFFKPDDLDEKDWDEVFSDFEWNSIKVEITNEFGDKQALLTSLNSAFQTLASLAGRPMTADERMVFNRIMGVSGAASPLELSTNANVPSPIPAAPAVGGGQALPAKTM